MRSPSDIYNYVPLTAPPASSAPSAPNEADLGAQLTQAIVANDTAAARRHLEDAVARFITLRPTSAHLFVAAKNGNRDMCQLLTAYTASWTPQEAKLLLPLLTETPNTQNFLRRFSQPKTKDINAAQILLLINGLADIYDDKEHMHLKKVFQHYLGTAIDNAIETRDNKTLQTLCRDHRQIYIETTPFIKDRIENGIDQQKIIADLQFLQKCEVPIKAVDFFELAQALNQTEIVAAIHWMGHLHQIGLIDPDREIMPLRMKIFDQAHSWFKTINAVKKTDAKDEAIPKAEESLEYVLAILCSLHYPVSKKEAETFIGIKPPIQTDFLNTLVRTDYFAHKAFAHTDFFWLMENRNDKTLKRYFNFYSSYHTADTKDWSGLATIQHGITAMLLASTGSLRRVSPHPPAHYPHLVVKTPEPPPPPPRPPEPRIVRN